LNGQKKIIIRLPASVDTEDLQDFLNYALYKELTAGFKVNQIVIGKLSEQINSKWRAKKSAKVIK